MVLPSPLPAPLPAWIKKLEITIHCPQESHLKYKGTSILKVRGWKKIHYTITTQKKAGIINRRLRFQCKEYK